MNGRLVSLTLAAVLATAVCIACGLWQATRTRDIIAQEQASANAPVPVLQIAAVDDLPAGAIGHRVTVDGSYGPQAQQIVAQREADGAVGVWVIAPVRVDDVTVAVLRGWVPSADSPALALSPGEVQVEGVVQPFEDFYVDQPRRADGQLVAISRSAIEQAWGTPVVAGLVVLSSQTPSFSPAPVPVPSTIAESSVPLPWQNAAYTVQWFCFAIFVWVMWWLWVRREPADDAAAAPADSLDA